MRVLHIAPHLGGGLGKALAAVTACLPDGVAQTFLLLEAPINRRYVDEIIGCGHKVRVGSDPAVVAMLASEADVVQFEYSNHPLMYQCLACTDFPAMRSVFWSHISGLYKPYIAPGLIDQAHRFVFSSKISLLGPHMENTVRRGHISVINSGFGFPISTNEIAVKHAVIDRPRISYLGTVSFAKMHENFFHIIDALKTDINVDIWGAVDPAVRAYANNMKNKQRFLFHGETMNPAAAFKESDIFFYPLQREHYGTGENALIEAMSMGLASVVLNNPAEMDIVTDCKTALVAKSTIDCEGLLEKLIAFPGLRNAIGRNAADYVVKHRQPAEAANDFVTLWRWLIGERPTQHDFKSVIGDSPLSWYLSTQSLPGLEVDLGADNLSATKGSKAHFQKAFPSDPSWANL